MKGGSAGSIALDRRESARVGMLVREHAWVGFRYGQRFGLPPAPSRHVRHLQRRRAR
jgi:hypothetical protein